MISQIVGISELYDQNGDRVSKNVKSCHICSMRLIGVFMAQYEKSETLFTYEVTNANHLLSLPDDWLRTELIDREGSLARIKRHS